MTTGSLVGRERESAVLRETFDEVLRGRARAVLLRGEAGIGKSKVVRDFVSSLVSDVQRAQILQGQCTPREFTDLTYAPLVQIFRPLQDTPVLAQLPVHHREALRPILPLAEPDPADTAAPQQSAWTQTRLFEVVLAVLRTLSVPQPLVLVIEDIHWADRGTAEFVQFMAANPGRERIMLVLTQRSDEVGVPEPAARALTALASGRFCEVVDVDPLDETAARELLRSLTSGAAGATDSTEELLQLCGGNPLYLEQLAMVGYGGRGKTIPQRVQDLLGWRVDSLGEHARAVLDVVAVSGSTVGYPLLTQVLRLDPDDLDAALSAAAEARLIDEVELNEFALHHELLAAVIYARLRPGQRQRLHRQLAECLAAEPDPTPAADRLAAIARHWRLAGRRDLAFEPMLAAGLTARAHGRQAEAAERFAQALELWPADPDGAAGIDAGRRCDVLGWWADSLRWTVDADQVVAAYRRAVHAADQLGDRRRTGVLQERLARTLIDAGQVAEAETAARDAVGLLDDAGVDAARALATLGAILMVLGDFAGSQVHCRQALALADEGDAPAVAARALRILGVDLANLGRLTSALSSLQRALQICADENDVEAQIHTHINLSYVLERAGQWRAAVASARTGRRLAASSGLESSLGGALLGNEISSLVASCAWSEAIAAAQLQLAVGATSASRLHVELVMAELEVVTGELDRADARLAATAWDELAPANLAQRRIVEVLLAAARDDALLAYDSAVAAVAALDGEVEPYLVLRLCAAGLRALADLQAPAARALVALRGPVEGPATLWDVAQRSAEPVADLPPCQVLLELCRVEAARASGTATTAHWLAVSEQAGRLRQYDVAAYATFRAAEVARSPELIGSAARLARSLGAPALTRQVERLGEQEGVDIHADGVDPHGVPADDHAAAVRRSEQRMGELRLTSREREVVSCLAAGMSNRLIARELSVTEKTASVHVSNVLGKLRVRSRAEAVSAIHQLRLVEGNPP